jgi:osmoprotectant transport system substrate-binding protein/osmoprotectant transport system permease protein
MNEQLALLPEYLTAHLQLTLVALAIGAAVSVPLGIVVTRRPRLEAPVLGVASVIQTIPGLALLAIMVPALAALAGLLEHVGINLRAIGYAPAIVALSLYSVLPMLRNTVTGIAGVDPALCEAARGVGMTERQQLWRVELPLALPVIVAGVRTAAVWVVGTATLSTPVGATSLGNFIFSGLQTRNLDAVLVGCVAAAGLAMLLDQLIRLLEIGMREGRRRHTATAALGLAALCAYTTGAFAWEQLGHSSRIVRIGAKAFTEQYVLAELIAQHVVDATGAATQITSSLGSKVAFDALSSGDLDVYVDYTGTLWATVMKRDALSAGRAAVLEEVRAYLDASHGIVQVGPLGFENSYALAMRADKARALGVTTLSQLAPRAPALEIGGDYEFFQRAEWRALRETYGLAFRRERSMDASLMYRAVAENEVDVIAAYSTDGRIAAYQLVLLDDDRGVIPPYDAVLLASARLARERPDVMAALRGLVRTIDAAAMRRMNLAVDRDARAPAEVAREFLAALPRAHANE